LNCTVTPLGWPLALSVTAELNPPPTLVLTAKEPLLPAATEMEAGDGDRAKDGTAAGADG